MVLSNLRHCIRLILERMGRDEFVGIYDTAELVHRGQKRRSGEDYFEHPKAVRNIIRKYYPRDKLANLVALLHDTFEDTEKVGNISVSELEALIQKTLPEPALQDEIFKALKLLTHKEGIPYPEYLLGVVGNITAFRVKLADMLHNATSKPSGPQLEKYQEAFKTLRDQYRGIPPGISKSHWLQLKEVLGV